MTTPLCKYKDFFGKPRKGAHSYRIPILDIAAVDLILTILAAWAIAKYFDYSFWMTFLVLFILGYFFHVIFCVDTKFTKFMAAIFQ